MNKVDYSPNYEGTLEILHFPDATAFIYQGFPLRTLIFGTFFRAGSKRKLVRRAKKGTVFLGCVHVILKLISPFTSEMILFMYSRGLYSEALNGILNPRRKA